MAQPPIKRADAMPMAIDIVGVSDRYNFGRSAASGKQKCCMYYQDNNKRVVLFNRMWSCMDMVHYGPSAVQRCNNICLCQSISSTRTTKKKRNKEMTSLRMWVGV